MKTFCVSFNPDNIGQVLLAGSSAHYIKNVMRLKIGAQVILFNKEDKERYYAEIQALSDEAVHLNISEKILLPQNDEPEIFLAFSLLKGNNNDLLIKKATEVGVKGFVPFISERTVIKKDKIKNERWEKLILSAVEQSKSQHIPFLDNLHSFADVLQNASEFDAVLIGDASFKSINLSEISFVDMNKILIVIGPEGGFSAEEMRDLQNIGQSFSFGENVLRAETAGIVLPALVIGEIKRQYSND